MTSQSVKLYLINHTKKLTSKFALPQAEKLGEKKCSDNTTEEIAEYKSPKFSITIALSLTIS